jgi:HAD superfamily hydrolase (TIGR01509 family)
MLGLPDGILACLFDLDGVLAGTADVHRRAWQQMFDAFLRDRDGAGYRPFAPGHDYDEYIDGKPREDGVRDFLRSRHIELPEGRVDDPPAATTVYGLGTRKYELFLHFLARDGARAYPGSVVYVTAARDAGLRRFVVSSSANTEQVLHLTGLDQLVEGRVDGNTLAAEHLRGKPAPDSYLAAARLAGVPADAAAVFEDALSGVAAGRAGRFGYVVGVNRDDQADALRDHGADVVVDDLGQLLESSR